jgi:hypothetical protein
MGSAVVTDVNFPTENQVVDIAVARAAKPVPVADVAPPTPDGLVAHQPTSSRAEVLRLGAEAMERLTKSRSWDDWKLVLAAIDIGRTAAMLEAGINKPCGLKYNEAFRKWTRLHPTFEPIANFDKGDRSRLFECFQNLVAIDAWRAKLSPTRKLKLNYPPTVLAHWKKSQWSAPTKRDDSSASDASASAPLDPIELRRQLEILTFPRFCKEVLPDDWRVPLSNTTLALASPQELIAALERRLSTRHKDVRTALGILKGFIFRLSN